MSRMTSLRFASSSFCRAISSLRSPSCEKSRACSSAIAACSEKLRSVTRASGTNVLSPLTDSIKTCSTAPPVDDRRHERLARAERLQREPPEDVVGGEVQDVAGLAGTRHDRRDLVGELVAFDRDVRIAGGIRKHERRSERPFARDQSGLRSTQERDRFARDRALHEFDVERFAHAARRFAQRLLDFDLPHASGRDSRFARVLLRPDAQITDQDEGRGQEQPVSHRDAIPMIAGLSPIDVARDDVRDLGDDYQISRQPALQRKTADRNRTVEENRGNEELRGYEVDDPGRDEQAVTEQGHRARFRAERRERLA